MAESIGEEKRESLKVVGFILTSGLYGIAEVFARLIQFGALFWLARICTKFQYGQAGLLFSLQQIVAILSLGGTIQSMTGMLNEYRTKGELPRLFLAVNYLIKILAVVIIAIYIIASVSVFQRYLVRTQVTLYLVVLFCGLSLAHFRMRVGIYQLQENHGVAIFFKTMPLFFCYLFGIVGLSFLSHPIFGFFAGCAAGLTIFMVIQKVLFHEPRNDEKLDFDLIKFLFRDSLPFLGAGIAGWLSGYGNNFLIKVFFSNSQVAEFTMVFTLNFLLLLVINSISQVWAPRFYKMAYEHSGKYVNEINGLVNQGQLLAVSVLSGIILLYFRDGLNIGGGNLIHYRSIHPYLAITFSSYIFLNLYYRSSNFFLLHRKGTVFFKIILWTSLLGAGLSVLLMWFVGPWGIYLGFLFTALMRGGTSFWYAFKKWGIRLSPFDIPLGLCVVAGGSTLGIVIPNVLLRTIGFMTFLLLIIGLFYLLNHEIIKQYVRLL